MANMPSRAEFKIKLFDAYRRYVNAVDDACKRNDWAAVGVFGHRRDAIMDLIRECDLTDLLGPWLEEANSEEA